MSNIPWPVSATVARQEVTGSAAPTLSAAQSRQEIVDITRNANRVVTGDLLVFVDAGPPRVRAPLSCSGTTCSAVVQGTSVSFGLAADANFGYDIADIQPIMVHNGINIAQIRARSNQGAADQVEGLVYGGWMEYSGFAIEAVYYPSLANQELVGGATYAFGTSQNTDPATTMGYTATWTGAVVGVDYSVGQYREHIIHGTSTITADFTNNDVDVTFSNLVDLDDTTRSIANMAWNNIPVSAGTFSRGSSSNQINGRFYGPSHEEVAGTFDRNQIGGAFGAIRETTP